MYFSTIEQVILGTLVLATLFSFSFEIYKRFQIVMEGTGNFKFDSIHLRLKKVFVEFILQKKVLSQRFWPGLMHALVFWGFMFFGIITIDHFFIGFNKNLFSESFKSFYATFFGIPWAIFVIIGILSLAYRRFIKKPKYLGDKVSYTSGLVAIFIITLMITYIIDISYHHNTGFLMKINWWIHAVLILAFFLLV